MKRTGRARAGFTPLVGLVLALGSLPGCATEAFCFAKCDQVQNGLSDAGPESGSTGGSTVVPIEGGVSAGGGISFGGGGGFEEAGSACSGVDLTSDVKNCGTCGNVCVISGASAKCVAGECQIERCATGRYDLDGDVSNGCEYSCTPSTDPTEVCNERDDNCDGRIDEGFDLTSDVNNCGLCNHVCSLAHAEVECKPVGTPATPTCSVKTCEDGHWDLNGIPEDGCEYSCTKTMGGVEVCDGVDNDCNGVIDDDSPETGQACDDYCPNGVCTGECTSGSTLCLGGDLVCIPGGGPTLEVCDGKDNDCDGAIDNGFDFTSDPHNCGACGNDCTTAFPHAIGTCVNSTCTLLACNDGYRDYDAGSPGCEPCEAWPTRDESCNGIDDDCDGIKDNPSAIDASKPPVAALCKTKPGTPCATAAVECLGSAGWGCVYSSDVELDSSGKVRASETLCDGLDGNCDGQVDESFPSLNTPCDDGNIGVCRSTGVVACDPTDHTKTLCAISSPGIAPGPELCNGLDDDCNGMVDEGTENMQHITSGGLDFYIDTYEASRPNASALSVGSDETHVCSNAGVLPWASVSYDAARAACLASGRRLCTAAEMLTACQGSSLNVFPYGNSYDGQKCNGLDYTGNLGLPIATGSLAQCVSPGGVFDLSGNVNEWTSDVVGSTGTLPIQALQGGSYLSPANGLTCAFDLDRISTNAVLPSLGFRCCKNP